MELQSETLPEYPEHVTDAYHAVYRLVEMLGQGGQGAVFRTNDNRAAVKLVYSRSPTAAAELEDRLDRVKARRLWDWPVSRPAAVLREAGAYKGYVMELQQGTKSIWSLMNAPHSTPADLVRWYNVETGGLRRRLVLLAGAAETLAWLHGIPYVYADASPNNILIPQELADEDVWLIDPDNIGIRDRSGIVAPDIGTPRVLNVMTPGYAAPEISAGTTSATTLSDAFSFGLIAFQTLTGKHAFVGDVFEADEPARLTEAYSGKWPWIEHEKDTRNRNTDGLQPRWLMLSGPLRGLARQTFEDGLHRPESRPGVAQWADELRRAADLTLPCGNCAATFYAYTRHESGQGSRRWDACPWCDHPRDGFAILQISTWIAPFGAAPQWNGGVPEGQPPAHQAIVPVSGFKVCRRHAVAGAVMQPHHPLFFIRYTPDGIQFVRTRESEDAEGCDISIDGSAFPLEGNGQVAWRGKDQRFIGPLHFGPRDSDHRVAMLFEVAPP